MKRKALVRLLKVCWVASMMHNFDPFETLLSNPSIEPFEGAISNPYLKGFEHG